jgi:hypothetical protein
LFCHHYAVLIFSISAAEGRQSLVAVEVTEGELLWQSLATEEVVAEDVA